MIKRIHFVIALALFLVPALGHAQARDESWTREMKMEFRQSCAAELERVGMTSSSAWSRCDCMTERLEAEFGLAEFGYFAAAEERQDTEILRRSERASVACFE